MTEDIPSQKNDEVLITGEAHKTPEASNVLTKLVTKDEAPLSEKGKSKLELPNFDDFSADELHAGYLSRLSTSRDMETSMVNMMKRKYETLRIKAETSLQASAEELEKIKVAVETERAAFETEKAALIKRAEDAEGRLNPVTEELARLKHHISQMTQAIFGNRSHNLREDNLMKLKVVYSFLEKLYVGSLFTIKVVMGGKEPPQFIRDMLKQLSTIPKQIEELKKSVARAGAITSLSRAKAYAPDLDPSEMAGEFPQYKDDGTEFSPADYARCVKGTRVLASQLVEDMDLKKYQPAYDSNNTQVQPPSFESFDLTPQRRKHTFAPDVDPSPIMHDDAVFQALTAIDWNPDNLQIKDV